MSRYYILDGHQPTPVDVLVWAKWSETADRYVAKFKAGDVAVSTVFLGIDHAFGLTEQPQLFETMIFGGPHDDYCERYATWDEAEAGHAVAVALVEKAR